VNKYFLEEFQRKRLTGVAEDPVVFAEKVAAGPNGLGVGVNGLEVENTDGGAYKFL